MTFSVDAGIKESSGEALRLFEDADANASARIILLAMETVADILIIEDDPSINEVVCAHLERRGYRCRQAFSGTEGLLLLREQRPDVVITDLMLPGVPGEEIVRAIRGTDSALPIIVISARITAADKISLLQAGADDYLTKPFGILELKARVQALLRRTARNRRTSVLTGQDITLNCDTRDVTKGDAPLELTFKEFELLKLLMENSDRVMTRSELLNLVWGIDFEGETRTLDMHIRTLRQKLGDDAETPRYIRTVRGVGYRFNCG